jgi:hypothetical protein
MDRLLSRRYRDNSRFQFVIRCRTVESPLPRRARKDFAAQRTNSMP